VKSVSTGPELGETEIRGSCFPIPVTEGEAFPPLLAKLALLMKVFAVVGLKRTVTGWLCPAVKLKGLPATTLKGALALAVPVRVPPPVFWTVKSLSLELPTLTLPKSSEPGERERMG
jgi:hypothetical protein